MVWPDDGIRPRGSRDLTLASRTAVLVALILALVGSGCDAPATYEPMTGAALPIAVPAQRPSFTAGDEFWFDTGDGTIFVEVFTGTQDGLLVFDRGLEQEILYYSPDLSLVNVERPFAADRWFNPDDGALDFPLAPGKTWTRDFRVRSSDTLETSQRKRSCEVLDTGWVEVPAGRFAAYRIACIGRELGAPRAVHEDVFYAPEVGRVVLVRVVGSFGDLQLIEFTRAAPK